MNTKVIWPAILVVLLTACTANTAIQAADDQVAAAAATIADFDLPADYSPEFTASLDGYTFVSYNLGDDHSHLYLIQSEKESDGEKLASALEQISPGSYDPQTRMTIIETRPVTVRGQEVTLVMSEGVTSEGEIYRQIMVPFKGKGGPALIVLSEPVSGWDQEMVDTFLASIR